MMVLIGWLAASSCAQAQSFRYFCASRHAPYPSVATCPEPWETIPVAPGRATGTPPDAGRNARSLAVVPKSTGKQAPSTSLTEEDISAGYVFLSVPDYMNNHKQLAKTPVIITGHYFSAGQMEYLSYFKSDSQAIPIGTDALSRHARIRAIDCAAGCGMTIWAHEGCEITVFGQKSDTPCLVVDRFKLGTYESGGEVFE